MTFSEQDDASQTLGFKLMQDRIAEGDQPVLQNGVFKRPPKLVDVIQAVETRTENANQRVSAKTFQCIQTSIIQKFCLRFLLPLL